MHSACVLRQDEQNNKIRHTKIFTWINCAPTVYREQWYDSEPADWHIYYKYNLEKQKKNPKENLIPRLSASLNLGSGQQVICPASRSLNQVVFPVALCGCECLDELWRWAAVSARARSEEAPPSSLRQRWCSEPRPVSSLSLSLAPSSWKIKRKSHSHWVTPPKVGCMPAVSVVYGVIQQRSLFARGYGKCVLKGKTKWAL